MQKAFDLAIPLVYTSMKRTCAMGYPCAPGVVVTKKGEGGGQYGGGEILARDGTPPLRVLLRLVCPPSYQVWHKQKGNNDQHGFRPCDVYISHIVIYALPFSDACPGQLPLVWHLRDAENNESNHFELEGRVLANLGCVEVGVLPPETRSQPEPLIEDDCLAIRTRLTRMPPVVIVDWASVPDPSGFFGLPRSEDYAGGYGSVAPVVQPEKQVAEARLFQGIATGVGLADALSLQQEPTPSQTDSATQMVLNAPYAHAAKACRQTACSQCAAADAPEAVAGPCGEGARHRSTKMPSSTNSCPTTSAWHIRRSA